MEYSIVYFAFIGSNYGGIEQKIFAQYDALAKISGNTHLFLVSTFPPSAILKSEIEKRNNLCILVNSTERIKNPFSRRNEKFGLIAKALQNFQSETTLIYFRFPGADYYFYKFVKSHSKKGFKIVTEHQQFENPWRRGKINGYFAIALNDYLFGSWVRSYINGFVGVTNEIMEYQQAYTKEKKPGIVIPNGINYASFNLRDIPVFDGKNLKILFVGAGFKTHGLHRVINGIREYAKKNIEPIIEVILVGTSPEMDNNIKLIKKFRLEKYFRIHGEMYRDDLNQLFNDCHIAIGNLGYHRLGMKEACIIKVREYFCRGMPFFTSPDDPDIIEEALRFQLKFNKDESNINLSQVVHFVSNLYKVDVDFNIMRTWAEDHLDWNVKMKKLKSFFDKLMNL